MQRIEVNDQFTVGTSQPDEDELRQLATEGFASVVNLRVSGDEDELLLPDEEGDLCNEAGMEYAHVPIDKDELAPMDVDHFREQITELTTPVFIHCGVGGRAAALTMMHVGVEEGMSGDEVLMRAEELGIEWPSIEIEELVRGYVDQRTGARRAAEGEPEPPPPAA